METSMAQALLDRASQGENMAVSMVVTPTKQQPLESGTSNGSLLALQQSPKDAEEVVDLLLRELIPEKDWDVGTDSSPPVLVRGEEPTCVSFPPKTGSSEKEISIQDLSKETGEGTREVKFELSFVTHPVKSSAGEKDVQVPQCHKGNEAESSVLKDLIQCLGESSSEQSSVGAEVTQDDDIASLISEIDAYLSEDDGLNSGAFSHAYEELNPHKGTSENLGTNDIEKTELGVPDGIHEDFDTTIMIVDRNLQEVQDDLTTDQESLVVANCSNVADCTHQVAVLETDDHLHSGMKKAAPQDSDHADNGYKTGILRQSGTNQTRNDLSLQQSSSSCATHEKFFPSNDAMTVNKQTSLSVSGDDARKDCAMATLDHTTEDVNVSDDVVIDLCVTPEEEGDLVDQDYKDFTESKEDDLMETDSQFKVIDVWPKPADKPPQSSTDNTMVGKRCSSNPNIILLCDHTEAVKKSQHPRQLSESVHSTTVSHGASGIDSRNDKQSNTKTKEVGKTAMPTENNSSIGSTNSNKEVLHETSQRGKVMDLAEKLRASREKRRHQQSSGECISHSIGDGGSDIHGTGDLHQSSSVSVSHNSLKSYTQNSRISSSASCDAELLLQDRRARRNRSPEFTDKSEPKRSKPRIKPIVWDRSPDHSCKTAYPVALPAQKKVLLLKRSPETETEGKQNLDTPVTKNISGKRATAVEHELLKPQKKATIKKIVWDRSPARQKDTKKKSPIKDGNMEIRIPNNVEATKDVRLVYNTEKPLSPNSKNKLLEHLLKLEQSEEVETEKKAEPSKLKLTISKSDTKVTVLHTESEPEAPHRNLQSVAVKKNTVNTTKSVAAKSISTKSLQKAVCKPGKHVTLKGSSSSDHSHEPQERMVLLKEEPKTTAQTITLSHKSKEKPQDGRNGKEKSTDVCSSGTSKRKRKSKQRKKSGGGDDSSHGHGRSLKKAKLSNDIEDELSSLLEVTPTEARVPRPKLSEKSYDTKEEDTCIPKGPVDGEAVSDIEKAEPHTEVKDLSEKLSRSRAIRHEQQTMETEVDIEHEVHSPDKVQELLAPQVGEQLTGGGLSQHLLEEIIPSEQLPKETEQPEVRSKRQVVILDEHISNLAAPEMTTEEEDLDTIDLTSPKNDVACPIIQVSMSTESTDLKKAFQTMIEEEDFYNEHTDALNPGNAMEEIIAQERLLYTEDINTSEVSTLAVQDAEDDVSDILSGYETVDEVVDSDNEVQVDNSDSLNKKAGSAVSSPCVSAPLIISPCQNEPPTELNIPQPPSPNISVSMEDSNRDSQQEMKEYKSTGAVESVLPSFPSSADETTTVPSKDDLIPKDAEVSHEEPEKVPTKDNPHFIIRKDISDGEPSGVALTEHTQSATSTDELHEDPVELANDHSLDDLTHDIRELLEMALAQALSMSGEGKDVKESGASEESKHETTSEIPPSGTYQTQRPTSTKEVEANRLQSEENSADTSAAMSDQCQSTVAKESETPENQLQGGHTSENASPVSSICDKASAHDNHKNTKSECAHINTLPPASDDKISQEDECEKTVTTENSSAVVLEVCIGEQGQEPSSEKALQKKDSTESSIAKVEKDASDAQEAEQKSSELVKTSTAKSDEPVTDIRLVQDSHHGEPTAGKTSLEVSGPVGNKSEASTDITTVFTRLENSPQKKSESGVFNRLGGYSTKLKGKKSRAECSTKQRFHPYQGKAPVGNEEHGSENSVHLCKESVQELSQLVNKGDKPAGSSRGRKKFKKPRPPRSRLYNKLQDRLQQEGRDIRETYYLDDVSENPYDEGRFTGRGSDPMYCLEEMPCVRNVDPSDMTSKTYRFKATIKVKFPKRDKDFHSYPVPLVPRFRNIPDKFARHQMNKKEKAK